MKSLNRKTKEGEKKEIGIQKKIYSRIEKEGNKTPKVEYIFLHILYV